MKDEKYEPIKFETWQELAKFVIDGGEVYYKSANCLYYEIQFSGVGFNVDVEIIFNRRDLYIKKQPTLEELIAIKPRLCWVWDYDDQKKAVSSIVSVDSQHYRSQRSFWRKAQMLTDDEIKQFLSDGDDK